MEDFVVGLKILASGILCGGLLCLLFDYGNVLGSGGLW